jgi:soluble lytic murein transglycosylase
LETPGQLCRKRLRIPLRIILILACFIPTIIRTTPDCIPSDGAALPRTLLKWDALESISPTDASAALKRAIDHYDGGEYASALEDLPGEMDAGVAPIGDYVLLYRAKAKFMMERQTEALEDFALLQNRYPDSPLIQKAKMGQCQAYLQLKEPRYALAILDHPETESNIDSRYYRARALDLAGEKDKAAALYLQIYASTPTSEYASLSEEYLVSLSPEALRRPSTYGIRLERAENLLNANDPGAARALLVGLGRTAAPDAESAQRRFLLLAEAEYQRRRSSAALSHLQSVEDTYPRLHARALYLEGACYRRLGRERAFLEMRDKALKLYPESPHTEELAYSVATYFVVNYQSTRARDAYALLYRAFPEGRRAENALSKLALFSYLENRYSDAVHEYRRFLHDFRSPSKASLATYWMGRCYEKLGNAATARYLYGRTLDLAGTTYYGQLARKALSALPEDSLEAAAFSGDPDFREVIAICDELQHAPVVLPELNASGIELMERARYLAMADLHDLAAAELRWAITQHPNIERSLRYLMSKVYEEGGDYYESIVSLRRAVPDYFGRSVGSLPESIWKLLFPLRHWQIVASQAAKTQLDPFLILALIRQESAFEERAHSRADARGLMQILPSTGRMLAQRARLSGYSTGKLYQADVNIALGTRHLASLKQKYDKTELALTAYNAGETRVKQWMQEYRYSDMAEFVEQIPFTETRNYVKRILGNRGYYELLVPGAEAATPRETE